MNAQHLNTICFTTCIVCIVLGTVLGLAMIWGEIRDREFVWKSWLTIAIFFLASALTLSVRKTMGGHAKGATRNKSLLCLRTYSSHAL